MSIAQLLRRIRSIDMKLGVFKESINVKLTGMMSLLLIAGFSTVAFAAIEATATENIKATKDTTQFIAKAPTDKGFKTLDVDADGKISLKEAVKDRALAEKFNATDVNHDGAITVDEYALYASTNEEPTAVN